MPVSSVGSSGSAVQGSGDTLAQTARDLEGQFMKLLVAEMRYQDPMSPMESKEFMAQVAQISTLDSINKLRSSFEGCAGVMIPSMLEIGAYVSKIKDSLAGWASGSQRLVAAALVGKTVKGADAGGEPVEGLVWGVRIHDGVKVLVGETEVALDSIVEVR